MQKIITTKCGGEEDAQELFRFSKDRDEVLEAKGDVAFLSNGNGKIEIGPVSNFSAAIGLGYSYI